MTNSTGRPPGFGRVGSQQLCTCHFPITLGQPTVFFYRFGFCTLLVLRWEKHAPDLPIFDFSIPYSTTNAESHYSIASAEKIDTWFTSIYPSFITIFPTGLIFSRYFFVVALRIFPFWKMGQPSPPSDGGIIFQEPFWRCDFFVCQPVNIQKNVYNPTMNGQFLLSPFQHVSTFFAMFRLGHLVAQLVKTCRMLWPSRDDTEAKIPSSCWTLVSPSSGTLGGWNRTWRVQGPKGC